MKDEDQQVEQMQAAAVQKHTHVATEDQSQQKEPSRVCIELDGVLACMRRGSVVMEKQEVEREGDRAFPF